MPRNNFLDKSGLGYLWGKITNKITASEANITAKIPKKTSQLENDSNFAKKTDIPAPSQSRPKGPTTSSTWGIIGTGTNYAREDHQHPRQIVQEAEVKWGGGSLKGDVTPIDAAMLPMIGYNKTDCANPAGITVEYSNDAGATWVDYGLSDIAKSNLVSVCGNSSVFIGGGTSITQKTLDDKLRITVNAYKCRTYTALKKILIEMSTNGATDTKVLIEKAKGTAPTEFTEIGTYDITGWSGWNSIDIGRVYFGGGSEQNIFVLRFTFSIGGVNAGNYKSAMQVMHILFLGTTNWGTPSAMARGGHLYTYDVNQNAVFPANVKASTFSGNANEVVVSFTQRDDRANIMSGERLTTMTGKIAKWFADLNGLAFKDKVDKTDLSDAVQASLDKAAVLYTSQDLTEGQKVQARTNINAAPGGFGLGGAAKVLTEADNVDNIRESGWYTWEWDPSKQPAGLPEEAKYHTGNMRVDGTTGGNYTTQTIYFAKSGRVVNVGDECVIQRLHITAPWEWINPPMQPGVEYRTTERYNNKTVYKKLDTDGIVKWRADGETAWHAAVTYGTSDLTAGTSALPTGQLYVVYE